MFFVYIFVCFKFENIGNNRPFPLLIYCSLPIASLAQHFELQDVSLNFVPSGVIMLVYLATVPLTKVITILLQGYYNFEIFDILYVI